MWESGPKVDPRFYTWLSFEGLEGLGSERAEVSVLPGDVACRVLVTDFIFNKPSFLCWFPNKKKKNRLLVQSKVTLLTISGHNTVSCFRKCQFFHWAKHFTFQDEYPPMTFILRLLHTSCSRG